METDPLTNAIRSINSAAEFISGRRHNRPLFMLGYIELEHAIDILTTVRDQCKEADRAERI